MKVVRNTIAALAVLLVVPAAAQAHTVSGDVNCTNATFNYSTRQSDHLDWQILVNGVVNNAGTYVAPNASGSFTVPYTAPVGTFTVSLTAHFPASGESLSPGVSKTLMCQAPPAPTPPVAVAPPVAPAVPAIPAVTPTTPVSRPGHKPRKRCVHGRRHLRDSHGRRITVCRQIRKPAHPGPNFTG